MELVDSSDAPSPDAPPSHQELHRDRGILAGRHRPVWRHWREPCVFALAMSWPAFLALIAGLFLAINLLFAALHRLDPAGIAGGAPPRASVAEAFFFSVQTLGSIGYGMLHPVGLYANLLVTAESLCGLLFVAFTTGLAFARSTARIPASDRRPSIGFAPARSPEAEPKGPGTALAPRSQSERSARGIGRAAHRACS